MPAKLTSYVRAALLTEISREKITFVDRFLPLDVITNNLKSLLEVSVPDEAFYEAFDLIMESGGIVAIDDPAADVYYKLNRVVCKQIFASELRDENSLTYKYASVGADFLQRATNALRDSQDDEEPQGSRPEIPASDRIVTLSHNQAIEIEKPLDSLIEAVEGDNGLPESPGLRELLLGQIRAGRELIRVGTFKIFILQLTLLQALEELVRRYKDHAIGAAAGVLLELIAKNVFGLPL